jgi:hypothetical protein
MAATFVTAIEGKTPQKNSHDPFSLKENRNCHLEELPVELRLIQFKAGSWPRGAA